MKLNLKEFCQKIFEKNVGYKPELKEIKLKNFKVETVKGGGVKVSYVSFVVYHTEFEYTEQDGFTPLY